MTLEEIETLAFDALVASGTGEASARAMARAARAAERDGIASHGLHYIPIYCEHVQCGKVDGTAVPQVSRPKAGAVVVDAGSGFAHPAIDAGFEVLVPAARELGSAGMAVRNSYNCGVLAYHTERLAQAGLLAIGFTNAPASIAPLGGHKPVIGTNPFSLAVPGDDGAVFVIDQSASVVAKSEIMVHARDGREIPQGWALDENGEPTTDPQVALKGSMAPSGGYKGFGVGLLVEVMAAAMAGATLGKDASPFSGTAGGPPNTGQFFLALDPEAFSGGAFGERISGLVEAITAQPHARIPGSRRAGHRAAVGDGTVEVNAALVEKIRALC